MTAKDKENFAVMLSEVRRLRSDLRAKPKHPYDLFPL